MPGAIFESVLGNLAVAAVLAAIALAVARRQRVALAHALWLLLLLKLITPPFVRPAVPCLPTAVPAAETEAGKVRGSSPTDILPSQPVADVAKPRSPASAPPTAARTAESVGPLLSITATGDSVSWKTAVLVVWALGTAVWLTITLRRVRLFTRLLRFAAPPPLGMEEEVAALAPRMGLDEPPRVRVLPGTVPPFVWAIGRPTLYFPTGLVARTPADGRLALLAHELAHLRRRDHLVRWLESIVLAVYWWCPLVWLARRQLRRLEEEACDAEVVAALPDAAHAYASAVLETIDFVSGGPRLHGLATAVGDALSLRGRLELILQGRRPDRPTRIARVAFAVVAVALLLASPRAARLTASVPATRLLPTPIVAAERPGVAVQIAEPDDEAAGFLPRPTRVALLPAPALPCLAAALTTDGSRMAIATGAGVRIYDLATERLLFELDGHRDAVNSVAFSADGSWIATGGGDGVVSLWDAKDGRELHALTTHGPWVFAVVFSPDGRLLASGGYDCAIRLWDVATGELRATLRGHAGGIRGLTFSPDGRTLASAAADDRVRLWNVADGSQAHTLKRHAESVRALGFSPDGSRLATVSEDRMLRVWIAAEGREIAPEVQLPDAGSAVRFSQAGRSLIAGTSKGHLLVHDPENGQLRGYLGVEAGVPSEWHIGTEAVTAILDDTVNRRLYSIFRDGTVLAWMPAGQPQTPQTQYRAAGGRVTAVAVSPDGRSLATGARDGVIRLWNVGTASEIKKLAGHRGCVTALHFAAGERLVSAGEDERVHIWDLATGQTIRSVVQSSPDLKIALSSDGCMLAVAGRKMAGIALWDAEAGEMIRRFGGVAGGATSVAFAPAGDRLAAGYADGMVRIWDPLTGKEVQRGQAGSGSVDDIAFGADGRTAAVVINRLAGPEVTPDQGPAHEVVFFDAREGTIRDGPRPLAHPGPVSAAAFSPDASRVLTAARDGNLYLWEIGTGRVSCTLRAHAGPVRGLALAPDGSAAYSAGDGSAKRWPMPWPAQNPMPPSRENRP
jgi:WD40 repeat protein/beta-lactamase regulating signal transducer with metallopeptidase domain